MSKDVKLELADPKEFDSIVDFVLALPITETQNEYIVDEYKVVSQLVIWVAKRSVFVLKDDKNSIVGILALAEEQPMWWSNETVLTNPVMYILPEYRSKNNFQLLLDAGQAFADAQESTFLPGLFIVDDISRKIKLFERQGYGQVMALFKKVG